MQSHAIYFHIPFCQAICTYCAFNTYAGMNDRIDSFVEALVREIIYVGQSTPERIGVKSLFFGGGTPSLLAVQHYQSILKSMRDFFDVADDSEITVEANPNDLSLEYLEGLQEVGINRLSIGIQSAKASELQLYGRLHTVETATKSVETAKRVGFHNISVDLIFGNPYQTLSDWHNTLQYAVHLNPQHISLYGLEVKGGTVLKSQVRDGIIPSSDDDLMADMYDMATEELGNSGYEQYEISNWCRPGFEGKHNLQYWHNMPYLGLGAGAHGYAYQTRTIVTRAPNRYIELLSGELPKRHFPRTPATSKTTVISKEQDMQETLMTGMRLVKEGVNRKKFFDRYGVDITEGRETAIMQLVELKMVTLDETALRLTKAGRFISNSVISRLI